MCQSANTEYSCGHYGPREISLRCDWAIHNNVRNGCYNTSDPQGIEHLDVMCAGCITKRDLRSSFTLTHVGMDGIRRPWTRESTATSKLDGKLDKQEEKRTEAKNERGGEW